MISSRIWSARSSSSSRERPRRSSGPRRASSNITRKGTARTRQEPCQAGCNLQADAEGDHAADGIKPEVVRRDDDREHRRDRVRHDQCPRPTPAQHRVERHGAPDRPSDVQTRHCGVLVTDGFHGAGLEGPQAAGIDQGVGVVEAVLARAELRRAIAEQSGRHQWEERKADERDTGGSRKGRPHEGVALGMADEQQHHCADGHGEVERAVEDVPEDDEPVPRKEGVVDPLLDIEPHRLLDVDDAFGVAE